jgi:hypothetical protein
MSWESFNRIKTAAEAARVANRQYERPRFPLASEKRRIAEARAVYDKYKDEAIAGDKEDVKKTADNLHRKMFGHRGKHSASAYPGLSGHGPGSHAMAALLVAHEHRINGGADVNIRLAGFPKGTKTSASSHGIFTKVAVNRGRAMANAETS